MQQQQLKYKMIEQPENKIPICEEKRCIECNRTGDFDKWELCENRHYQYVCNLCLMNKTRRSCVVKNCEARNNVHAIRDIVNIRQCWLKNYEATKRIIKKFVLVKEELISFSEDTWDPFRVSVEKYLRTGSQQSKPAFIFEKYIGRLTNYILNLKISECRQQLTSRLYEDDLLNSQLSGIVATYEQINTSIMTTDRKPRPKQNPKLQKFALSCLVCYHSSNILHAWTYCENDHPHNGICKGCLLKLRECPVCRGKLRIDSIRACQNSMEQWNSTLNKHISINEMLVLINKESLSKKTKGTILKKVKDMFLQLKKSDLTEYLILIENLALEWCNEWDSQKSNRLFNMILAYEHEYELIINLKRTVRETIARYDNIKKQEIIQRRPVQISSDSQSLSSYTSSENHRQMPNRPIRDRRRQLSYSRSRSRSRSRDRSSISSFIRSESSLFEPVQELPDIFNPL